MASHDIIAIGASAGGVEVVTRLVAGLPPDLAAAVFIVIHIPPSARSVLPEILSRSGQLPAAHPRSSEEIRHGRIYVAPPDRHLIVEKGQVLLSAGPRENRVRPAVDALFRSAAIAYGNRVVGVVLTGTLSDGTAGLYEIKRNGGVTVVQDPNDAPFPDMPTSALEQVPIDYVLPATQLAATLAQLTQEPLEQEGGHANVAPDARPGQKLIQEDSEEQVDGDRNGEMAIYVCPECGGSMWQVNAGNVVRFTCHVGHAYSADDLLEGSNEGMERTLGHAARALRDRANLRRQLAKLARERNAGSLAALHDEDSRTDLQHAEAIERMLAASRK